MAGETPDYGVLSAQKTVYPVNDQGEAAVRLGSIVSYDRRGDVIFLEDFELGIERWKQTTFGTGAAIDWSIARSRSGLYSCRLVGGSTSNRSADIRRRLPFPVLSTFGVEASFSLLGTPESLQVQVFLFDGVNLTSYAVRYNGVDSDFEALNSSGLWTDLDDDVDLLEDPSLFHTVKMVFDAPAKQYVRALLDNQEYDAAPVTRGSSANAAAPHAEVSIAVISDSGDNDVAYIDDVIFTINEPGVQT